MLQMCANCCFSASAVVTFRFFLTFRVFLQFSVFLGFSTFDFSGSLALFGLFGLFVFLTFRLFGFSAQNLYFFTTFRLVAFRLFARGLAFFTYPRPQPFANTAFGDSGSSRPLGGSV